MLRRISLFALVGLVAVFALAACGGEKKEVKPTVTRVPASNVPQVSPTPGAASPAASPAAGGTPAASPAASPVASAAASPEVSVVASPSTTGPLGPTVDLLDIHFDPNELTIPANTPVTITVTNKGAAVHTFDIDALNIHSGPVQPGTTITVNVNAAAGDYEYYCAEPGHKQAGMVGTLHVVASGESPPEASPESGRATPQASPVASPAVGGVTAAQTIDLEDIKFDPKEVTISANTDVTINLTNKGVTAHTFDVDALNIHTGEIAPGTTKTVTINAAPGQYQYYCAIPGHKQAGMVGTLTVQ
jgi:plastocyanin